MWKTHPRQATQIIKKNNKKLFDTINSCTGATFSEKSWIWLNTVVNHGERPSCYCGKSTKYLDFRRGYMTYCSTKCLSNSERVKNSRAATTLAKYNQEHYSRTDEYRSKFKHTMLSKYGVENPGQIHALTERRARNKQLTFFNTVLSKTHETLTPLFTFDDYTHLRDKNLSWQCNKCHAIFKSNLLNKLPVCLDCNPKQCFGGKSDLEKEIVEQIKKIYNGKILENVRTIISPKELDIYFPDKKFAIEINGIYWHSEDKVGRNYHREKYTECRDRDIQLLMITDYEWHVKKDLIINMIKHRLGIQDKTIYARQCSVKTISSQLSRDFLNKYHMNGFTGGSIHYGLYYLDELCAVCTVSSRNRLHKKDSGVEIVRLAYANANVVGAFGKFLKQIKRTFPDRDIISYVDLRYGSGTVYEKTGFKLKHITDPGYWYYINGKLDHRLNWTKKKLVNQGLDPTMTESEIMLSLNAVKIYDCGHKYMILKSEKNDSK